MSYGKLRKSFSLIRWRRKIASWLVSCFQLLQRWRSSLWWCWWFIDLNIFNFKYSSIKKIVAHLLLPIPWAWTWWIKGQKIKIQVLTMRKVQIFETALNITIGTCLYWTLFPAQPFHLQHFIIYSVFISVEKLSISFPFFSFFFHIYSCAAIQVSRLMFQITIQISPRVIMLRRGKVNHEKKEEEEEETQ